ncbi:Por secretion system C-terminal sorting domain-containing protein [Hyunsoonleella jejuensis]|uniref:Por secretion system C-terminal sorting domain-containing protein n=1 Tax=Hyunsoonleella jejuensis TaxID=419940 RepID=A0A1H9CDE4_9FLAO|nr:LamG-like jellyroll fold domain-containing protein [Hyunsoonleella jejuensis]SEP99245.1 Por secretion system C-terminal sorting domain-containing protein [Hyunsoonleella jejuensis]
MKSISKKFVVFVLFMLALSALAIYLHMLNKKVNKEEHDYPVWIEMMETPGVNLEEARQAFDAYWEHHEHYRGDKSKKFERWYARNSKRLDAYGNVVPQAEIVAEYQKARELSNFAQQGQWINYGPIDVGPRNGIKKDGGRVKDVEFHPTDPNMYYVSCFKGGLFTTDNAGLNWTPLTDQIPDEVLISKVRPSNPSNIIIGTDLGVKYTTNGGTVWNASTGISGETNALIIKPDNENIVIAGNDFGIYRSVDGGVSFVQVQSAKSVEELRMHPTNPQIMYAGTNGGSQNSSTEFSQFFRSIDGGLNWVENTTDFGDGTFMKIAVTPAQPNYVYVINSRDHLGTDSFDGVYRSTDSGASFTKRSVSPDNIVNYNDNGNIDTGSRGQPNYNLFIVADPNNADILYGGGVKSWKSVDGGANWTQFYRDVSSDGGDIHIDQLTWAYSPHDDTLFAVNDGGIYYLNSNDKFQQITDGLPIAEVWECTQSQQNSTNVAGGTFHCGIKLNRSGVWTSPWGGDESTVLFDYSDDTYAYHFKYDRIHRSSNGGMTFQRINNNADRGEYTGTGVLDKSDVNTLFVGLFEVERINNARTANSSTVWDKISSFGGSTRIQKIEQSDADHNILYVSRGSGSFYRSDNVRDASPVFTNLTGNLIGSGKITDIATHPTNANIVYVLRGNKVYRSPDKGGSWTDISTGLPNIPLLEMVYDKTSDEGIYIGTDMGVYYKDATMGSWIDYSNGLAVVRVSGMDIYYGANRNESFITVSTDGRGFWRSALNDVTVPTTAANFSADTQTVIVNNSVSFTDASTGDPMAWEWVFEGGTPETSTSQTPVIQYATTGTYKVTLKVSGLGGIDTREEVGYITVINNPGGSGPLQAHYNFDQSISDSSSYSRGLSVIGGFSPSYVDDRDGNSENAYLAPGSSGFYLTNPYKGIGGTGERTVTAWIKTTTAGTRKTIVSWGANSSGQMWNVMVENGNIRVEGGGSNVQNDDSTVARLDGDTWRHIAVTYNPTDGDKLSDVKLYIDGVYYANQPDIVDSFQSETTVINTENTVNDLQIGNAGYNDNYYWLGELDDVRIYSKALTIGEINTVLVGGTLSIENNGFENNEIKVYPNPVKDFLKIKSSNMEKLNLKLFDIKGKQLNKVYGNKIDMSSFVSGFYILTVSSGVKQASYKILKN